MNERVNGANARHPPSSTDPRMRTFPRGWSSVTGRSVATGGPADAGHYVPISREVDAESVREQEVPHLTDDAIW